MLEKYSDIKCHEISSVGAELFHVEGERETYITKLIVACRSFANIPENYRHLKTKLLLQCLRHQAFKMLFQMF